MKRTTTVGTSGTRDQEPVLGYSEEEIRLLLNQEKIVFFRVEFYDEHDS